MYNDDDEEDKGMLCCSRIVLFIVGVVLLGVGIHFYVEAENPVRQEKVVKYDQSVYEWNHEKKAQMEASSFNMSIKISSGTKQLKKQAALLADTDGDQPVLLKNGKQDDAEEISTYSTLRYDLGADGGSLVDDVMVNFTDPDQTAQIVIQARHGSSYSELTLEKFPLHHQTKKALYGSVGAKRQHCNSAHGNLDNTHGYMQCHVISVLQSVCIEIELDVDKKWQLSPATEEQIEAYHHVHSSKASLSNVGASNRDTYGCDIHNNYHPATYSPLKLGHGKKAPEDQALSPFQVTVRSSADPFLELELITEGSLYFGLSQHEQRATGGVCIGVGLLVLASPLIYLYLCWRRCKEEHKAESEPLAFNDVSVGSASGDASASIRHRRARDGDGTTRDIPVIGPGMGGDAYITDLVRQHREREDGNGIIPPGAGGYDDEEYEEDGVINEAQLSGALEQFSESAAQQKKVPLSNVVPVDAEGEMVRERVDVEMVQMASHEDEIMSSQIPTAETVQSRRRSGSGGSHGSGSGSDTASTAVRKLDD